MAEYREAAVDGIRFTRPRMFILQNPFGDGALWRFTEEEITVVDDVQVAQRPEAGIDAALSAASVVTLRDPSIGATTGGTITEAAIFLALWSLWYQLAQARDAE